MDASFLSPTSLFRPDGATAASQLTVHVEGQRLAVAAGTSVAATLLLAGAEFFRSTPVSGAPRAPYCMMGVCFECLVQIDGVPNRQACLVQVRDGMHIARQIGARTLHTTEKGADDAI